VEAMTVTMAAAHQVVPRRQLPPQQVLQPQRLQQHLQPVVVLVPLHRLPHLLQQ
jgi:hypothetical protein